jgi:serine/threonine protein kinase
MREILRQVLAAVAEVHAIRGGLTHRDVKPQNLVVAAAAEQPPTGRQAEAEAGAAGAEDGPAVPLLQLVDFGSAVDPAMPRSLWPPPAGAPTAAEETEAYSPPEVLLSELTPLEAAPPSTAAAAVGERDAEREAEPSASVRPLLRGQSYDLWSVGVVWLELVFGTSDVWAPSPRATAFIEAALAGQSEATRHAARQIRGMAELCVYAPAADVDGGAPSRWEQATRAKRGRKGGGDGADGDGAEACTDEEFAAALARRDPAGVGLPDAAGRALLRRLLAWAPADRVPAAEALEDTYFAV